MPVEDRVAGVNEVGRILSQLKSQTAELIALQEELRKSREEYEIIVENTPVMMCRWRPDGRITFANRAFKKYFCRDEADADMMVFPSIMPEESRKSLEDGALLLMRTEKRALACERRVISRDGVVKTQRWTDNPVFDGDGTLMEIISVGEVLPDNRSKRQAVRLERRSIDTFLRNAPFGMIMLDHDNVIKYVNPRFTEIFGYEARDVPTGREWLRLAFPEAADREEAISTWKTEFKVARPGQVRSRTTRVTCKNGNLRTINFISVMLDTGEFVIMSEDITAREESQRALQKSERQLRLITENIHDVIWTTDLNLRITFVSPSVENLLGCSVEEALQKKVTGFLAPEAFGSVWAAYKKELKTKKEKFRDSTFLVELDNREGGRIWAEVKSSAVYDENMELKGLVGITRDVTKRKLAEDALRDSEEKFRAIFNSVQDAIFVKNRDGVYIMANAGMERIMGMKASEIIGSRADAIFAEAELDHVREIDARVFEGNTVEAEETLVIKSGPRTFLTFKVPIRNGSGDIIGLCGVSRDMTQTRQLEAKLRQSQKMEAIGTLAGGIAHDFNNILASIMGYTELALCRNLPKDSPAVQDLESVLKASYRAKDLISQILTFSRQTESGKKRVQLTPVIKESVQFLRATLPSTIRIRECYYSSPCNIIADQIQIHQVMMNLCSNAAHSMRERGGVLEITLQDIYLEEEIDFQHKLWPGEYVRLSIRDTGHGIDPAILGRIFDPYFTMKGIGEGTGLGLSVVYGIMKGHGGSVVIESEPGKGTVVHAYFPVCDRLDYVDDEAAPDIEGGSERILFVDDEEPIVKLQKEILEYIGYKVSATTDAHEAIEEFRKDPQAFDIVISDQTMPSMTGLKLADELTKIRRDIPIILCTGFSAELTPDKIKGRGIRKIVYKPLSIHDWAQIIRGALDDSAVI
jgi:PAS domain S-box-containing protein